MGPPDTHNSKAFERLLRRLLITLDPAPAIMVRRLQHRNVIEIVGALSCESLTLMTDCSWHRLVGNHVRPTVHLSLMSLNLRTDHAYARPRFVVDARLARRVHTYHNQPAFLVRREGWDLDGSGEDFAGSAQLRETPR